MDEQNCLVCDTRLKPGLASWHLRCSSCLYEYAALQPAINNLSSHALINEEERRDGLRELRRLNFQELVRRLKSLKPGGGAALDVGSAHGWFLEVAKDHFEVLGIEPDKTVWSSSAAKGLPARLGYFPDSLNESEKFDVITFNDVFEHIRDSDGVLTACYQRLREEGVLLINLPSSSGFFYRLSKILTHGHWATFFERLWQKDMPSPHLHYFNLANLSALLAKHGFEPVATGRLPTLRLKGLYYRISCAGNLGLFARIFVYVAVTATLPFLAMLPGDIVYVIARKA